ncbi:MAG: hypothetical protein FWG55_07180 [Candidatus Bathyarchaeota archaeon]|nr:hypothetical protein [Candidatus Termiticorpusculum sp.]
MNEKHVKLIMLIIFAVFCVSLCYASQTNVFSHDEIGIVQGFKISNGKAVFNVNFKNIVVDLDDVDLDINYVGKIVHIHKCKYCTTVKILEEKQAVSITCYSYQDENL